MEIVKPVLGLSALLFGAGALAWLLLTKKPPKAAPLRTLAEPVGPAYLNLAAADVGIEFIGPDSSTVLVPAERRLGLRPMPNADGKVDCNDVGSVAAGDSSCTMSIALREPPFGDYRVVVSAARPQVEIMTIGWGGEGFQRNGGLSVKLIVDPRSPVEFTLIVAPEGVSQRTEPRPIRR